MPAGILGGFQSHATTSCPPGLAISSASHGRNSRACRCRRGPIRHGVFQVWGCSTFRPTLRARPLSEADSREILERSTDLDEISGPARFRRRSIPGARSSFEKLRKAGVIFQPLERAMIEHEDLFRRHFMSQPATLGSAKFAALHEALVRSGTFLYVPRGVEIELPLETFHWLHARERRDFPAHARRRRGAVESHAGRTFPLDRSRSAPASPAA